MAKIANPNSKSIRILIADDHALIRQGLKQIVADNSNMIVADEADNFSEMLRKARKDHYDVVVLDLTMPEGNALDSLKQLKEEKPQLPVLILSIHSEEQYALRMLKAGASGYLTKESAPEQLIEAIGKIVDGEEYIAPTLVEKLAYGLVRNSNTPSHTSLTDREYQVFTRIASGKTAREIADELFLSSKTVSTYRTRLFKKMHIKSNNELIRYAFKNGLAE